MSAAANAAAASAAPVSIGPPKADLNWDDDELETQIYDNPEEEAAAKAAKAGLAAAPVAALPAASSPGLAPPPADEPDLSSLVRTSKGWGANAKPNGANGHAAVAAASTDVFKHTLHGIERAAIDDRRANYGRNREKGTGYQKNGRFDRLVS